jgi:hypothetical protein
MFMKASQDRERMLRSGVRPRGTGALYFVKLMNPEWRLGVF